MGETIDSMQDLLVERIETWRQLDRQRTNRKRSDLRVITVSRQAGTGGKMVATLVAQELGLSIYDREIIQRIAKRSKMDSAAVEEADEDTGSVIEECMSALVKQRYLVPQRLLDHMKMWPGQYLMHLNEIIQEIARGDGGVIVGRGANFLMTEEDCLRVRMEAPLSLRVRHAAELFQMKKRKAKRYLKKKDAKRRDFIRHHFDQKVSDTEHYDLVLSLGSLTIEEAAASIVAVYRRIHGK